jgi:hypothetical protein
LGVRTAHAIAEVSFDPPFDVKLHLRIDVALERL